MTAKSASRSSKSKKELSFEDIMTRLEGLVERLEDDKLPLEQAVMVFEEGMELSKMGTARLDEAEHRVEKLVMKSQSGAAVNKAITQTLASPELEED